MFPTSGDGSGGGGIDQNWLARLRDLLCELYEQWGGNCAELGQGETNWIDTVCGSYAAEGAPHFEVPAEKDAFLSTLTELETHLGLSANTLSAADTGRLTDLIADLRTDLGV